MRHETTSLLVAITLHGVLFLAIVIPLHGKTGARRVESAKTVEVDLDVEESVSAAAVAPARGSSETERAGPRAMVAAASAKQAPRHVDRAAPAAEPTVHADPSVTDGPADRPEALTGLRPQAIDSDEIGLGISNPLLAYAGSAGPEGPPPNRGVDRAMRTTLRDRDRDLGLGASGPVVAAAEEVARTSTASVESRAVLEVTADAEGRIVSVIVGDTSEDRAGWDAVAASLLRALRDQRVRVPRGSHGLAMTIAIESRETMPSGAAPGVNVTLLDRKIHSGKNARSTAVAILPLVRVPILVPVPGHPGQMMTKEIVLPVPLPQIGAVGDLSDIGAPATRVVHAHATAEREL